jgi:hypothetical protein
MYIRYYTFALFTLTEFLKQLYLAYKYSVTSFDSLGDFSGVYDLKINDVIKHT